MKMRGRKEEKEGEVKMRGRKEGRVGGRQEGKESEIEGKE